MKILLAINTESLEQYISNKEGIEVCAIVRNKENLLIKTLEYKPDCIMVSHNLSGNEDKIELITKLTSKSYPSSRIIYLYGKEDIEKREFINFLITRGVYDYHVGERITPDIINELIFKPKSRDDVKAEIIEGKPSLLATNEVVGQLKPEELKKDYNNDSESTLKFVQEIIKELSDEKKIELGLVTKQVQVIEKTIIQNNIIGSVIIGVAGASVGIGCTHVAISIAHFLSTINKKNKVAIIEMNDKNDFIAMNENYEEALLPDSFTIENIDFYCSNTDLFEVIGLSHYDYIVLDIGRVKYFENNKVIFNKYYSEFLRANLSLLVCGTKPWQLRDLSISLFKDSNNLEKSESQNWKLLFNFINEEIYNYIKKDFDWSTFYLNYEPELFKKRAVEDNCFEDILQEVLIEKIHNKKRSFWSRNKN